MSRYFCPSSSSQSIGIQTPQAPESLEDLLRSPHNPAYTYGSSPSVHTIGSASRKSRWNGFHLWRTESEDARKIRQRRVSQIEQERQQARLSSWPAYKRCLYAKLSPFAPCKGLTVYGEETPNESAIIEQEAQDAEPMLSEFGLIMLTLSLAGAQLAWTLELAYGTPYLLSLGLSEQSTSLVWLVGPLSGLIVQPIIGSLSDASTSSYRRRRYMIISAILLTLSTLVLAFSVIISTTLVDMFGGGLSDWDPQRNELVHQTIQWISIVAFWILDFALNGLQAASRALILDVAPSQQQSVANAWHGRMTHAGNVVGYFCGWVDLASWKGLEWLGGGQFRCFAVVSLIGMLSCVFVTVSTIHERANPDFVPQQTKVLQQVRDTFENVWQTIRRLPRPVRRVCVVQFFAFMGWFPFLFYSTTYVLQMEGEQEHGKGDARAERGSFAMLMFALVALCSGALLPYLSLSYKRSVALPPDEEDETPLTLAGRLLRGIKHGLTLRTFWTLASLLFAVLMGATFLVRTVTQVTVVIALVGIPWSVATWAPFAMVAEFVREAEEGESPFEFEEDHWSPKRTRDRARRRSSILAITEQTRIQDALADCSSMRSEHQCTLTDLTTDTAQPDPHKFGGTILGIHNLAIVTPQFLVAIISSIIFSSVPCQGVAWVLRFGGSMAILAALATRFVPLTLTERRKR